MLQKFNQVIHDTLITNLQLKTLIELWGIIERLKTLLSMVRVGSVRQELGQTKQTILLVEIVLQVYDHIREDGQAV